MKKIIFFSLGSITTLLLPGEYIKYLLITIGIVIGSIVAYRYTKDTILVLYVRKKILLKKLWWDHFFFSPQFFLVLLIMCGVFGLVQGTQNTPMFEFIGTTQTWWMYLIRGIASILFIPVLLIFCVTFATFDEQKENEKYEQEIQQVKNWYQQKLKK